MGEFDLVDFRGAPYDASTRGFAGRRGIDKRDVELCIRLSITLTSIVVPVLKGLPRESEIVRRAAHALRTYFSYRRTRHAA